MCLVAASRGAMRSLGARLAAKGDISSGEGEADCVEEPVVPAIAASVGCNADSVDIEAYDIFNL